jgi:hypothetical protein
MYQPLNPPDDRHHDGTGWRGAAALFVVMTAVVAGHAVVRAASPRSSSRTTCTPFVQAIGRSDSKVVLAPGLHSGSFAGKDPLGNATTVSFTC